MKPRILFVICMLFTVLLAEGRAAAQDATPNPGSFVNFPIMYDEVVRETLTPDEFYDWWRLQAGQGDIIEVTMTGENGLAPLIGLLDPNLELVQRSEDGAINGTVTLQFTIPYAGQYTIVATRVGNAAGTTAGDYTLSVRTTGNANPPPRENPYAPVVIACSNFEMTTAVQLEFSDDANQVTSYQISVYGLDGFRPAIYLELLEQNLTDCSRDASVMGGDTLTLPGEPTITVPADATGQGAQLLIQSADQIGQVRITIGSQDGASGRYVLFIQGFTIGIGDSDIVHMRLGPLARATPLLVYMVAEGDTRLDPYMQLLPEESLIDCDDAGRRGCEDVPSFAGAGAAITANGGSVVLGNRFDAGLRLTPGTPDWFDLRFASLRSNTGGGYSIVLIGELPPRPQEGTG